ncbi:MAG: Ldh family oxidoreductase [Actinomycetota bacterium]|nr:Ldh family oxidoreductase [Actinomycetota bacterium]
MPLTVGALGAYVYPLTEAGLVGLVFRNGPAVMAPWGGDSAVLSTGPLTAGWPTQPTAIVVDLAVEVLTGGLIGPLLASGLNDMLGPLCPWPASRYFSSDGREQYP